MSAPEEVSRLMSRFLWNWNCRGINWPGKATGCNSLEGLALPVNIDAGQGNKGNAPVDPILDTKENLVRM